MRKLLELAWAFIWISTFTLGGGMAMLPFMEREFVERRKWMTSAEMTDIIAIVNSLPGIIAANMAVLVGYRVRGVVGAVVSVLAVSIVPFLVIVAIAKGSASIFGSTIADHVFLGVRAGTAALIAVSLVSISRKVLNGWTSRTLAIAVFVSSVFFHVNALLAIAFGFSLGIAMIVLSLLRRRMR